MKEILIVVILITGCLAACLSLKQQFHTDVGGRPLTMEQTAKPRSERVKEVLDITGEYGWKNDPEKVKRLAELEAAKKEKADPTKTKFATCE